MHDMMRVPLTSAKEYSNTKPGATTTIKSFKLEEQDVTLGDSATDFGKLLKFGSVDENQLRLWCVAFNEVIKFQMARSRSRGKGVGLRRKFSFVRG